MSPDNLLARSYRNLVLVENPGSEAERRWNAACSDQESFWERLYLRDQAIYFRTDGQNDLRLASIAPQDLPPLSKEASAVGRWLAGHSLFARILSSRTGQEEVTFYALLKEPHGAGLDRGLDRLLLNIGHAPLCYRRKKVVEVVRQSLLELIRRRCTAIGFLDIGSGGGFDGLDVHRLCSSIPGLRCKIINLDIDERWLANNQRIAQAVGAAGIMRRAVSVFDYLKKETYAEDLRGVSDLVVSCNGFADFFPDAALRDLLAGLRQMFSQVAGRVRFVFPAALERSRLQTFLSRQIGFNYTGRAPAAFIKLVEAALGGFHLEFQESHSQIICRAHKD
jgi:hypothetical protein